MQPITVEELINYKILPFSIYTKGDKVLFPAGEVLTPGKFLQLRHIEVIYRKPQDEPDTVIVQTDELASAKEEVKPVGRLEPIDKIETKNVHTKINKQSYIPPEEQVKLKVFYENTLSNIAKASAAEVLTCMKDLCNKIQQDYSAIYDKVVYCSQLKLLGDYDKCHALNVALLTAALSRKLGKPEPFVADVILAALLHDIGKIYLPKEILNKQVLTIQEQKLYQSHTKIGYNFIKNKLNLNERIAKVALEHHERNDGTGYPLGKSGDFISPESQIVSVCNYFDNLTCNRTPHKVYNAKDALKIMLEMGSKYFAIDVLYSFIYMYNYDDTNPFDEMTLV